jgi:hypothetical protein
VNRSQPFHREYAARPANVDPFRKSTTLIFLGTKTAIWPRALSGNMRLAAARKSSQTEFECTHFGFEQSHAYSLSEDSSRNFQSCPNISCAPPLGISHNGASHERTPISIESFAKRGIRWNEIAGVVNCSSTIGTGSKRLKFEFYCLSSNNMQHRRFFTGSRRSPSERGGR